MPRTALAAHQRGIVAVMGQVGEQSEAQIDREIFSRSTMEWLGRADLGERKRRGQYMTPRPIRDALLQHVDLSPEMSVLDPGVGTGEFLSAIRKRQPQASLHGWDIDQAVLEFARSNVPDATLSERSALEPSTGEQFDLVIGNPPYFQFRAEAEQRQRFAPVISGRPNIFALFFQVAFEVMKPGGQIAFVVPPSMNNGAYFESLRSFIVDNGRIEHLEVLARNDLFEDANTAAQLIVIRAGERGPEFHLSCDCPEAGFSRTIFSPDPRAIEREFIGRKTLWDLGYEAVTGTVVWNEHRDKLRKRAGKGNVALVWAHNIENGELQLRPVDGRPQYIRGLTPLKGPALLVNRIVGAVGKGYLRVGFVPPGMEFLAENHVNVIRARPGVEQEVDWSGLHAALIGDGVAERIRRLTGNTQLSGRELTHLIPLGI